jgi:hypothetical protein
LRVVVHRSPPAVQTGAPMQGLADPAHED